MNIIVCIKQVPDTNEVKIDQKTGRLIREGVPSIINPEDKNAIEAALNLKRNGKITVVTMGPPQAEAALREALAIGVDEAILLTDIKFSGSDTWATANALSATIRKIGNCDLIIFGRQAIDGDTAQTGPQTAENLKLPQITYVEEIEINGKKIIAKRALEDGYEIVEAELPVLITVTRNLNSPRYPTLKGIFSAFREKKIIKWTAIDINIDDKKIGLMSSPTKVKKTFSPKPKGGQYTKIEGKSSREIAQNLINILKEKEIIQEF